jgi:hypothetical protein
MENISLTRKPLLRRVPEPPPGLDEFEQHVMTSKVPLVVPIGRDFARALLRYVRRLERDVAEMGEVLVVRVLQRLSVRVPDFASARYELQQRELATSRQRNLRRRGLRGGCSPAPARARRPSGGAGHVAPSTSGFRC